jgi:hypothetical protein
LWHGVLGKERSDLFRGESHVENREEKVRSEILVGIIACPEQNTVLLIDLGNTVITVFTIHSTCSSSAKRCEWMRSNAAFRMLVCRSRDSQKQDFRNEWYDAKKSSECVDASAC